MKNLTTALLITTLASGGMGLMSSAIAVEHGMHGKQHAMHHGGGGWKANLTEKQTKQIAKLKLDYKKQVYPIKTKIKQAKVELAMLISTDKPKKKLINKKIDEIVKLKAEKMRFKATHKIEVRKVLNTEQRVLFDMKMLKKAYHDKKGRRQGHH